MIDPADVMALIPARGGSKRIPRKNIVEIAGRPLIEFTIREARASKMIGRVIVSTDDEEIAAIARDCGAETPFLRPKEYAADTSPDIDVFTHALSWLDREERWTPEFVVHLRPTTPGRDPAVLDRAIRTLADKPGATSLRGISLVEQHPFKMWRIHGNRLKPFMDDTGFDEPHNQPRQILPDIFWGNGYVDVIRTETIMELKSMYGPEIIPFRTKEVMDLDDPMLLPALEACLKEYGS